MIEDYRKNKPIYNENDATPVKPSMILQADFDSAKYPFGIHRDSKDKK